jgi:CubicO group peptidase (beta-lactamase class C family)
MTDLGVASPRIDACPRIDAVLQAAVDRGDVPLVVGVAADAAGTIYQGAAGSGGSGDGAPDVESIFRIASLSKIVCTVAALQHRDRGDLDLDVPVETYCPEFAAVPVLAGFDEDRPLLRPPTARATVRQLLTHTAGLAYPFWDADLLRWHTTADKQPPPGDLGDRFAAPMVADPGSRFCYGTSTDWLGRVLEAISGQSLDVILAEQILDPLAMRSTGFQVAAADRSRLVPVHRRHPSGEWVATDIDWDAEPEHWPAGHGLYSTPCDFLRFQRMLLGGGSLDGVTILAEETVAEMFHGQLGALPFPTRIATAEPATSCDFRPGRGVTWGWGLLITTAAEPGLRARGSGGWAGVFNTYCWVDPASQVTGALFSQYAPFLDPGALRVYDDFERSIYQEKRS